MNDLLFSIIEVVLISAIAAVLRYAIPLSIQLLRSHNYTFAAEIIERIVRCAEQSFLGSGRGDEKFEYVVQMAKRQFERYNIPITDDQLVQLLEAAVQTMNAEIKNQS